MVRNNITTSLWHIASEAHDVPIGNADVRRDFTDVRDVARAYRLTLDQLASGELGPGGQVPNITRGTSMSIREVVHALLALAKVDTSVQIEPALVRPGEQAEIVGDNAKLRAATGWQPETPISRTIADLWRSITDEGIT